MKDPVQEISLSNSVESFFIPPEEMQNGRCQVMLIPHQGYPQGLTLSQLVCFIREKALVLFYPL
jgi:hypothetical protein